MVILETPLLVTAFCCVCFGLVLKVNVEKDEQY